MHPILFSFRGVNFYSYGLFAALAFIFGYLVFSKFARGEKLESSDLIDKLLIVFIAGVIGARITYFALYSYQFANWWEIFYVWQGGLVSFGGIIGGLVAFFILFKKNLWRYLDILALSFLLSLVLWRIGCFLSGSQIGLASNSWLAIYGQVPVNIIESLLGLLGFVLGYFIFNKIKRNSGLFFFLVLIYYGIVRIIVDGYRVDLFSFYGFRWGQITGFIIILLSSLALGIRFCYNQLGKDKDVKKNHG